MMEDERTHHDCPQHYLKSGRLGVATITLPLGGLAPLRIAAYASPIEPPCNLLLPTRRLSQRGKSETQETYGVPWKGQRFQHLRDTAGG